MNLATILSVDAVLPRIFARDKKQALKTLSAHAATLTGLGEREIYSVLKEREQLGCTGMGSGVCIPHGRFEKLTSICALFATLESPVDFDAADGKPVDVFFMLLTPASASTEHVKALAVISRLLRDKALCEQLRGLSDREAIYAALLSAARGDEA
ncbi:MAG: transcriptional regulator [Alphaproteobacteria bacterium]|nr:transcriptional regulator [Alphaproteobacteria bacterium]